MSELTGKTALVTGATTGIGAAAAMALAEQGASVVVHGRDQQRGEQMVEKLLANGSEARFIGADLQDAADVARLAKEAGPVDILVNNAGIWLGGSTADLEPEAYDALFAANVRGAYQLTAALAPSMAERGDGVVINLSSGAALIGAPMAAAYGASKAAVSSLTRSWAAEFGPSNVRVNAVAPGVVITVEAYREMLESNVGSIPLGRTAEPSEIASVIAFLAGPGASYINGATIPVDGGRTAV